MSDADLFNRIIKADESEIYDIIKNHIEKIADGKYEFIEKNNYLFCALRRNCKKNILLSAHVDTVHQSKPTILYFDKNLEGAYVKAEEGIGGDDRAGIYAILEILSRLVKYECHLPKYLLFTDKEEIGFIGARDFVDDYNDKINVDLILEFDCTKDYVLFPSNESKELLKDFFCEYFPTKELPYPCDIDVLIDGLNTKGVNIGVGYEKWHKLDETINTTMLENQIIKSAVAINEIMKKGKSMKKKDKYKINMMKSKDLRVYKDNARPAVFEDKRGKQKHKKRDFEDF